MGFFGSFRSSGLFAGVADSFRDAFETFTLFPGDSDDIEPEYYDETVKRTVADAFKDVNQNFATILDNAKQSGILKSKNG